MSRRKYDQTFKREAVELTNTFGASVKRVAHELDVNATMLSRWRGELGDDGCVALEDSCIEWDQELAALRRELDWIKKTRGF